MANDSSDKSKTMVSGNIGIVKTAVSLIGVGMAVLLLLHLTPVDIFTIRLPRHASRLAAAVRVKTGQAILLSYRHSVELVPVEGWFQIGPGPSLLLKETRMMSTGTGLPNTYPDRTRREGQWIVVDEAMRAVGGFGFFLTPVNRTRLTTAGKHIDLDPIKAGSIIRLDVERLSLLRWLLWKVGSLQWYSKPEPQ